MAGIFSKISEPIYFSVSDMLKANCMFTKVSNINECANKLK